MKKRTMKIESPENRKVLYYLKNQNYKNIATINSIDEVSDKKYEVTFLDSKDKVGDLLNGKNKLSLKDALDYLIAMAESISVLHDAEEPVAVNDLDIEDFAIFNDGIKFTALNKLTWAEPEYVVANINSFLGIVKKVNDNIDFSGEKNTQHLLDLPSMHFRTMDLLKLELQRIYKDCFKKYNPKMPIGFRSGNLTHNVIALFIYFVMINITMRLDFSEYTTVSNGICRVVFFIIMLVSFFFAGNYMGVFNIFGVNKIKSDFLRYTLTTLLSLILFAGLLRLFALAIGM